MSWRNQTGYLENTRFTQNYLVFRKEVELKLFTIFLERCLFHHAVKKPERTVCQMVRIYVKLAFDDSNGGETFKVGHLNMFFLNFR